MQGGLDARFLISRLKPTTFKVKSLTTISTPHYGSSFADFVVEDLIGSDRVSSILGSLSSFGIKAGAFDDLTTAKMARFNVETPDDPSVKVCRPFPLSSLELWSSHCLSVFFVRG